MIKKVTVGIFISLFSFLICVSAQALQTSNNKKIAQNQRITKESQSDESDPALKEKAEFSCLKYAGIRLGNPNGLMITQIKGPDEENPFWIVVGNKIVNEDDERPISFSCRLVQDDNAFLWTLDDFSLFQITEDSVKQMKELQQQEMKKHQSHNRPSTDHDQDIPDEKQ